MRKTLANPVRFLSLAACSLALVLGVASCEWEAQIKTLDDQQRVLSSNYELLLAQLNELRAEHEKTLIEQNCKNPRVIRFLQECKKFLENGEGQECNKLNVEQALKFMPEERHVLVRLKPGIGLASMSSNRQNQLSQLLDTSKMKSVSSVLIIAQPPDKSPESGNYALEQGRKIRGYLRDKFHVPEQAMFRPLLISCRGKSQMLDHYANQIVDDQPDFEESQSKSAKIALWVFRLDCGNVATPDVDIASRQPPPGPRTANTANRAN